MKTPPTAERPAVKSSPCTPPAAQSSSPAGTSTMIRSMIRASTRLPDAASGGMPASGSRPPPAPPP